MTILLADIQTDGYGEMFHCERAKKKIRKGKDSWGELAIDGKILIT
jgi:hypothetical protein